MKNGESIKFPWYLPTVQLLKAEAILKKIVYYFFSYLPPIFTYKMKKVKDGSFHRGFVIAYSKSTSNTVKIKYAQKWAHDQKLEDGINENKEANTGNNIPYLRLVMIIFS